jgi:hypothetical protein
MIGRRSYREALTPSDANRVLLAQSGKQFDPELLQYWEELFNEHWREDSSFLQAINSQQTDQEGQSRHEHLPNKASETRRLRAARLMCNGDTKIVCLYAGRLKDTTLAPDVQVAPLYDVSRGGMCMMTDHPMYRGEVVHLRVNPNNERGWVRGVVAWCRREVNNKSYKAGIRLIKRISATEAVQKVPVKGMNDQHVCPVNLEYVKGEKYEDSGPQIRTAV